jgi:hypothetical protein
LTYYCYDDDDDDCNHVAVYRLGAGASPPPRAPRTSTLSVEPPYSDERAGGDYGYAPLEHNDDYERLSSEPWYRRRHGARRGRPPSSSGHE